MTSTGGQEYKRTFLMDFISYVMYLNYCFLGRYNCYLIESKATFFFYYNILVLNYSI